MLLIISNLTDTRYIPGYFIGVQNILKKRLIYCASTGKIIELYYFMSIFR